MKTRNATPILLLPLLLTLTLTHAAKINIPGICPDECSTDTTAVFTVCRSPDTDASCTMTNCGPSKVICRMRDAGPDTYAATATVTVTNARPFENLTFPLAASSPTSGKLDVYVIIDTTGSMGGAINNFRKSLPDFMAAVRGGGYGDVAFGLARFGDENQYEVGFRNLQPVTKSDDALLEAAERLSARGGGDGPEANLVALYRTATDPAIRWRKGARRIVVYMADYVGHEPTCVKGLPKLTRFNVAAALVKANVAVIAVSYSGKGSLNQNTSKFKCKGKSAGRGQGTYLTNSTGGVYMGNKGNKFDVEGVTNAISRVAVDVKVINDGCAAVAKTSLVPELPAKVRGNSLVRYSVSLKKFAACKRKAGFSCSLKLMIGSSDESTFTLMYKDVKGC